MFSSYILTISDLMTAQAMISQQILLDTAALQPLVNPSSNNLTPLFIAWAAAGFPPNHILFSMEFSPQTIANMQSRPNTYDYATQLLGTDLSQAVTNFGSNFQGMNFSFMTLPSSVVIRVSRSLSS
jgi:hypothetical protein